MELENKSVNELEELAEFYVKRHKQAIEAFRSDNVKMWDEKAKEYMEKLRKIDNELAERED